MGDIAIANGKGLSASDRATLDGLGTVSTQNANAVAITGGTITGLAALSTTASSTTLLGGAAASPSSTLAILASATVASAAGAVWNGVSVQASTLTLTGTTACNAMVALVNIAAPTITDASAVTVAKAATVYIAGPPAAGGSATLTSTSALVVAAGKVGLGTETPTRVVDIYNASAASDYPLRVSTNWTATGHYTGIELGASNPAQLKVVAGGAADRYFVFRPYSGVANVDAMSILGNGDVLVSAGNLVVGAAAAGTTAAKCLALSNSATAPTASADLAQLYAADHNGAAGSAALALYQEAATVTCGDQTVDRAVLATVNGVPLWIMARSAAPV